jgi:hypothetical protein
MIVVQYQQKNGALCSSEYNDQDQARVQRAITEITKSGGKVLRAYLR